MRRSRRERRPANVRFTFPGRATTDTQGRIAGPRRGPNWPPGWPSPRPCIPPGAAVPRSCANSTRETQPFCSAPNWTGLSMRQWPGLPGARSRGAPAWPCASRRNTVSRCSTSASSPHARPASACGPFAAPPDPPSRNRAEPCGEPGERPASRPHASLRSRYRSRRFDRLRSSGRLRP